MSKAGDAIVMRFAAPGTSLGSLDAEAAATVIAAASDVALVLDDYHIGGLRANQVKVAAKEFIEKHDERRGVAAAGHGCNQGAPRIEVELSEQVVCEGGCAQHAASACSCLTRSRRAPETWG